MQEEIKKVVFNNHSIVNNVLNKILKTEIVTRNVINSELKKIRNEMEQLRKQTEEASSNEQKALFKLHGKK